MLRYSHRGRPVAVPVGTLVYLQDNLSPFGPRDRYFRPTHRTPYRVEAWLPREIGASRRNASGRFENTFGVGGHLAAIRNMRTGALTSVADWLIKLSLDLAGEPAERRVLPRPATRGMPIGTHSHAGTTDPAWRTQLPAPLGRSSRP